MVLQCGSQSHREGHSRKPNALGWATMESPIPQGGGGTAESHLIPQWGATEESLIPRIRRSDCVTVHLLVHVPVHVQVRTIWF
jgi:hypothetical protein